MTTNHREDYERLMDIIATIDVMSDSNLMAQIRESEHELAEDGASN